MAKLQNRKISIICPGCVSRKFTQSGVRASYNAQTITLKIWVLIWAGFK